MPRIARLALPVFVLIALVALGAGRSHAQAPAQAPAAASMPAAPPAPPDVAAVPADAEKGASGLAWKVLKPGTGTTRPTDTDKVTLNYNAWATDGKIADSTDMRGRPATPIVGNLVPGMAEAVKMMTVGEKRRFWIPDAFRGSPAKPKGMCVFEIELLDISAPPPPELSPSAPPDVKQPPADAQKSKTGLASKMIRPGTGRTHPTGTSTVTVKYVGWTPDGRMIDASALQPGGTATFALNRVIQGWTEGVQLMVEGEVRRFWIPGALAYDNVGREDAPKGMLVFDVQLLKIQ